MSAQPDKKANSKRKFIKGGVKSQKKNMENETGKSRNKNQALTSPTRPTNNDARPHP